MPRPRAAHLLLTASLAVLAGACAQPDDPSAGELTEDLAEELREQDGGLSTEQAECFAGLVVEEVGVDDIVDVDFSDEEPPAELAEGIAAAAVAARDDCGLPEAAG